MKTPRELLLNRHRDAEPALDELRAEALRLLVKGNECEPRRTADPSERFVAALWRELFVGCRRYWLGLGAAWCVMLMFAVVEGVIGSGRAMAATAPSDRIIQAMKEQQQLRNELLGTEVIREARAAHREPALGPRSQLTAEYGSV